MDGSQLDGEDRRRRELADFLRLRRSQLAPEVLGLTARARRRTPGLRREDVAERAGVSLAWYTNLEQARPVNPSHRVIGSLADALLLSDADRTHLLVLTGYPAPVSDKATIEPGLLHQLVQHLDVPAYCTDALTNVLAWNEGAVAIFGNYGRWPEEHRNLLSLLFEQPDFADRLIDRDDYAARVVRSFRGRSDAYRQNPVAIDLVERLSRTSPRFKALWQAHDVRQADTDSLVVNHVTGPRRYTLVNLQGVASPGFRLSAYIPSGPSAA